MIDELADAEADYIAARRNVERLRAQLGREPLWEEEGRLEDLASSGPRQGFRGGESEQREGAGQSNEGLLHGEPPARSGSFYPTPMTTPPDAPEALYPYPPTICKCGLAASYHGPNSPELADHDYEPRFDPESWREGFRAALAASAAEPPTAPDADAAWEALRDIAPLFHEYAVIADDAHPAVTWERCPDERCARARAALSLPCTFHRTYGPMCGKPESDPVHPGPDDRMGNGRHVFRHDPVEYARLAEPRP